MSHVTPIFLFSLPRSGSTLVQRVLGAHEAVATASEPWLLLPFFYARRPTGFFTEYYHREYIQALDDFCEHLPGRCEDYRDALRAFALQLYSKASPDTASYFLDKTPRYHLIASEIIETFPESKVIFLWRNPLAVIASVMQTWASGRWNLYRYRVDLYKGLAHLVDAYRQADDAVYSVRYEDLVSDGDEPWRGVFAYLDLPYDATLLESPGAVHLQGRMGDPTGIQAYETVTPTPLTKWRSVLNNPLRKRWARRYLTWIGEDRLSAMGYELADLLEALHSVPTSTRFLASDALRMSKGFVQPWIEPEILRAKRTAWREPASLVAHG